eukprot:923391-Karenia_brevis.AAC.1
MPDQLAPGLDGMHAMQSIPLGPAAKEGGRPSPLAFSTFFCFPSPSSTRARAPLSAWEQPLVVLWGGDNPQVPSIAAHIPTTCVARSTPEHSAPVDGVVLSAQDHLAWNDRNGQQ